MSKREAGPIEIPTFGSIWVWIEPPPMMAICQIESRRDGYSRQWRFVTLDDRSVVLDMWVGSQSSKTWFVLDDD